MIVKMIDQAGACKTGTLPSTVTPEQIITVLGQPNIKDDPYKVTHSWGFSIDGESCGIWDYNGHRWSTYGPIDKINTLLGLGT